MFGLFKKKPRKMIIIPIERLAPIWLKHNPAPDAVSTAEEIYRSNRSSMDTIKGNRVQTSETLNKKPTKAPDIYEVEPQNDNEDSDNTAEPQMKLFDELMSVSPVSKAASEESNPFPFDVKPYEDDKQTQKTTSDENTEKPGEQEAANQQRYSIYESAMYQRFVEPAKDQYETQGAHEAVIKLIKTLEDNNTCSSFVKRGDYEDSESADLSHVRHILGNVSLYEHTFRVAENLINLVSDAYENADNMIARTVIAALAHDIGKIPQLRNCETSYHREDHPIVSAKLLEDVFEGKDVSWKKTVIRAVENHHMPTNDQFTCLLRMADGKAREEELSKGGGNYTYQKSEQWLDLNLLMDKIGLVVNVSQTNNMWDAFSMNGVVYCQYMLIYELAKKMALDKNVFDFDLFNVAVMEEYLKKIVKRLKEGNLLAKDIPEGKYGIRYELEMIRNKKKIYLIPLKLDAFKQHQSAILNASENVCKTILSIEELKK